MHRKELRRKVLTDEDKKYLVSEIVKTSNDDEKYNTMLMYDKAMRTVKIISAYENALKNNSEDLEEWRKDMDSLMEDAYKGFSEHIKKGPHYNQQIENFLKRLADDITNIKNTNSQSKKLLEFAYYHLIILNDMAWGNDIGIITNSILNLRVTPKNIAKLTRLLDTPSSPLSGYANVNILPIYAKNCSIGYNTKVFATVKGYYPVGFGEQPHPVHENAFRGSSTVSTAHDLGHVIGQVNRLQNQAPAAFALYCKLYEKLFEAKKEGKIKDLELKQGIVALDFLIHDVGYHPLLGDLTSFIERIYTKGEFIDYVKPMRDAGYKIDDLESEEAPQLKETFLQLMKEFFNRHPEINQIDYNEKLQSTSFANKSPIQEKVSIADEEISGPKVHLGFKSTFLITKNGKLYACGWNSKDKLGLKTNLSDITRFHEVNIPRLENDLVDSYKIACVASGERFSIVLLDDGRAYSVGENLFGQLGLGDQENRDQFTEIEVSSTWAITDIAAGYEHCLIKLEDGSVWSCGRNEEGQLGLEDFDDRSSFEKIPLDQPVKEIAASDYRSMLLLEDGSVVLFGLGITKSLRLHPNSKEVAGEFTKAKAIAAGSDYFLILLEDGNVLVCSESNSFQSKKISLPFPVTEIAAGNNHIILRLANGSVWTAGKNEYGQLGRSETLPSSSLNFQEVEMPEGRTAEHVSAGFNTSAVVLDNQQILAFGYNGHANQLGLVTHEYEENCSLPQLMHNPEDNRFLSRLNFNRNKRKTEKTDVQKVLENQQTLFAKKITSTSPAAKMQIHLGFSCSFLVDENGTLYACGSNRYSQLGGRKSKYFQKIDFQTFDPPVEHAKVKNVTGGRYFNIILLENGCAYSAGDNDYGKLGLGSEENQSHFKKIELHEHFPNKHIIAVAANRDFSMLLLADGSVCTCGGNHDGALGLGNNKNYLEFEKVTLPVDKFVTAIAAGEKHSMLLLNDGSVLLCGDLSSNTNTKTFQQSQCPPAGKKAIAIAAGSNFSLILLEDGSAWICNHAQQNGHFEKINLPQSVKAIAAGEDHCLLLLTDGSVWTAGKNMFGQLGVDIKEDQKNDVENFMMFTEVSLPSGRYATDICAKFDTSAVMLDDNQILAFGYNGGKSNYLGLANPNEKTFFPAPIKFPTTTSSKENRFEI